MDARSDKLFGILVSGGVFIYKGVIRRMEDVVDNTEKLKGDFGSAVASRRFGGTKCFV